MQRVNQSVSQINVSEALNSFQPFRTMFSGELGIQTMILSPWSWQEKQESVPWLMRDRTNISNQ